MGATSYWYMVATAAMVDDRFYCLLIKSLDIIVPFQIKQPINILGYF